MAFVTPTYNELVERMQSNLNGELIAAGHKPLFLERWLLWIFVRVVAAAIFALYGTVSWTSRQLLPTTADRDGLIGFASLYGLTPIPAAKNTVRLFFSGTNGTSIPIGTEVVRSDGFVYVTTEAGAISGSTAILEAEADLAGELGNVTDGLEMTLAETIVGLDAEVTVDETDEVGADEEDTEAFRARVLARIRETPQGGAAADYVAWMRTVADVYRAKALPLNRGVGTVDGVFLHESGTGDLGIPTSGQIAAVQAAVDAVRPVTADFEAKAPGAVTINVTATLIVPSTTEVKDAVEAEWAALFRSKALASGGTTLYVSELYAAAMAAEGITAITLSSPSSTQTCEDDEAFTLGTVTWP